jgi:hypothetical protein
MDFLSINSLLKVNTSSIFPSLVLLEVTIDTRQFLH